MNSYGVVFLSEASPRRIARGAPVIRTGSIGDSRSAVRVVGLTQHAPRRKVPAVLKRMIVSSSKDMFFR